MQCRLCNNDKMQLYYFQGNKKEFKFFKCSFCGLVNYDISTGLNQAKYGDYYTNPFDNNAKMNIAQKETYRFISSNIKTIGNVFDIGCGNGKLLYLLKKNGWAVKGLELSTLLADSIYKTLQIEVDVADFLKYNPPNWESFDMVILRHVLEHLPHPLTAMTKINSYLKSGGHVVMEFPNIEALDLKMKRFLQRRNIHQKKYRENYKPGHCNEYSKSSFEYLARKTGFEIIVFETYSLHPLKNWIYNYIPIGNKARTIIRKIKDTESPVK